MSKCLLLPVSLVVSCGGGQAASFDAPVREDDRPDGWTATVHTDRVDLSDANVKGKSGPELWQLGVDAFGWERDAPLTMLRSEVLERLRHANCEDYWKNVVASSVIDG